MDRTDFELLQSFVVNGDEVAFTAIMCRHGAMVRGVCERVLGDPASADDACQATFVMLAVQAPKLNRRRWRSATLGGWLYRVALNKAIESHRHDRSRRRTEQAFAANRQALAREQAAQAEVLAALDQELASLPDRFQSPLVLCHLEGKTQHEAAELLGLSYATVRRRIEQGRALLQSRLARRGFVLAAAAFAAFVEKTASAAPIQTLPPASELLKAAAAKRLASAAPNGIARLWAAGKLKIAAAALVGVGAASGAHIAFRQPPAGPEERPANVASAFAGRGDLPRPASQTAGSTQAGEPASPPQHAADSELRSAARDGQTQGNEAQPAQGPAPREPAPQSSERETLADSARNQPQAPLDASKDQPNAAEPKTDDVQANEPVAAGQRPEPLLDARPFLGTSRTDREANLALNRSPLQSVERPTRRQYVAARRQVIVEARERKAAAASRGAAPGNDDKPQVEPTPSPFGVVTLFRSDWRETLKEARTTSAQQDGGGKAK